VIWFDENKENKQRKLTLTK